MISKYSAQELYNNLIQQNDIVVLDVRNATDFARFQVESPYPFTMKNISYFDFMEIEEECVAQVREFAAGRPIRIVCAKEGSAKYVAEILEKHDLGDIGYLAGGIKSWGNLLVPVLLNAGEAFQLYQFIRPGKASCSYGLLGGKELQLFDPSRDVQFYLDFAHEKGVTISRSFETHLQADYIAGSRILAEQADVEIMANPADFTDVQFDYTALEDRAVYCKGEDSGVDGVEVQAIFTPGHTPGSTCFLIDNRFLISGDTVFIQSVGRPDLGGQAEAWSDMLFATLQKIAAMDSSLLVLPGHYMSWGESKDLDGQQAFMTSLKDVLEYNRAIYTIPTSVEFLEFIKNNMREQSDEYATIRKINAGLERVDDEQAEVLDLGKNECAATAYSRNAGV